VRRRRQGSLPGRLEDAEALSAHGRSAAAATLNAARCDDPKTITARLSARLLGSAKPCRLTCAKTRLDACVNHIQVRTDNNRRGHNQRRAACNQSRTLA